MLFDKLACAVEQQPELRRFKRLLDSARLFRFDQDFHKPQIGDDSDLEIGSRFLMPFDTVAIENRQRVSVLNVCNDPKNGIDRCLELVMFADAFAINDLSEKPLDPKDFGASHEFNRSLGFGYFVHGILYPWSRPLSVGSTEVWLEQPWIGAPKMSLRTVSREDFGDITDPQSVGHLVAGLIRSVVPEINFINSPCQFILEDSPVKGRKPAKGRILRSMDRPHYTVLKPNEIRRRMHLPPPEVSGGEKRPHERRAHKRRFRTEWYVNMRGQEIDIPATWIGPSDSVHNNRRYRVLLDVPGHSPSGAGASQKHGSDEASEQRKVS